MDKLKYVLGLLFITVLANGSFFADNNVIEGVSTIPSNGGSSTLLYNNNKNIIITGASNQSIVLPDATTMRVGNNFKIFNEGTGTVTVKYNDGTTIHTLAANEWSEYLLTSKATSNGTWVISEPIPGGGVSAVSLTSDVTGILPLVNGGTNNAMTANEGGVAYSGSSAIHVTAPGTSGQYLKSIGVGIPLFATINATTEIGGVLPLINGGTNNAMSANEGGIAYSGSSAIHITAPGSSGQLLQSNGVGIPSFVALSSIDHGSFGGLTDDDHTQYLLLAGRSGGQSAIGGTGASENLDLQSTSNGTKGQVRVLDSTAATSSTTGALYVAGGLGVAGAGHFGSSVVSYTGLTLEDPGAGTYKVFMSAPTLATDLNFILPATGGSSGDFLSTNGSGVLSWSNSVTNATNTTNVATVGVSSSVNYYPLFVASSADSNQAVNLDTSGFNYNPGTNGLSIGSSVVSASIIANTDLQIGDSVVSGNRVSLKAPTLTSNVSFYLPSSVGTANQVLKTDGLGNLSWTTSSFSAPRSQIQVDTGNGTGSTNTHVRRWTNVNINTGSDMTLTQSAGNGDSITINTAGVYTFFYCDRDSTTTYPIAITVNGSVLASGIADITYAQGKVAFANNPSGDTGCVTYTGIMAATDVVRFQANSGINCANNRCLAGATLVSY